MKQLKDKEYEEFQLYLYNKAHGYIWTPETLELICNGNDGDPEQIGKQMLAMAVKLRNEQVSHRLSGCMRMSDSRPWTKMMKNTLWCVSYEE